MPSGPETCSLEDSSISGPEFRISRFASSDIRLSFLPSLSSLLQACVNPDPATSSIGFLAPLSNDSAARYWMEVGLKVLHDPQSLYVFVLTAVDDPGTALGTIQLAPNPKETHDYKAEVMKLLVHPRVRRRGLGEQLMAHAERFAREEAGLTMLVLDTATETPAKQFYDRLGWTAWGQCPQYARFADGRKGDCTFYYKVLE